MSLPDLAIKRPIFITCLFIMVLVLGFTSFKKLGVDLFPDVSFPIVTVNTIYPGTGPAEIETLVSKPIEEELNSLSGIKSVSSQNREGISIVIAEFTLETDVKYAEQQVRDRIGFVKSKLPTDAQEPIIRTVDPADQPIAIITMRADLSPAELYDLADQQVSPLLEQVPDVGLVEILGGRKREIHVVLDRKKLLQREISAMQIANKLGTAGKNIPAGKANSKGTDTIVRTLGEFETLKDIDGTLLNFYANETPIRVGDVGKVVDTLEDEKSRTFVDGEQAIALYVFRRSGANTLKVVDAVKKRVEKINVDYQNRVKNFEMKVLRDSGRPIRANVADVQESILIGIVLTILVVFFFLGSARSTLITGIALPNSLLGAFFLMQVSGFTINVMTLLAMSLAVGLLIDDAIVVRENIFRHMEMGKSAKEAASFGTREVTLAVIATTATVIAVFGPVAFLQGIIGQFFKEFGLTICFAMAISLLDALAMAPMLSAYFAGNIHKKPSNFVSRGADVVLKGFDRFQTWLEKLYVRTLKFTLRRPMVILFVATVISVASFVALKHVPKTFLPAADQGEFQIVMDMKPGTDIDVMNKTSMDADKIVRGNKEVLSTITVVGSRNGEPNEATIYVRLVERKDRKLNTSEVKNLVREQLTDPMKGLAHYKVQDPGMVSGVGSEPFQLNIAGNDLTEIERVAREVYDRLKKDPNLKDVDIDYRPGKPELRVQLDKFRAEQRGVATDMVGMELRTMIEGTVPAVFRQNGYEYDIRVRLQEDQRNIKEQYPLFYVPNMNGRLVRLQDVAQAKEVVGPATIYRQDRGRYIRISASINEKGQGMAAPMAAVREWLGEGGDIKLGPGMRYRFVGQAESFEELGVSMALAAILAITFIYLVLSSLYESFITPFTIMLVLPLAACGAFYGLALMGKSLDIFSMIGCIMLLGVATKNSILLVDYTAQLEQKGVDMKTAIIEAGRVRLRPIIMTSLALIVGMLPVAIGLNEASAQRTSMGVAVIGGLISSTLLTLVVVPAAYSYIERFRRFVGRIFVKVSGATVETTPEKHEKVEV